MEKKRNKTWQRTRKALSLAPELMVDPLNVIEGSVAVVAWIVKQFRLKPPK